MKNRIWKQIIATILIGVLLVSPQSVYAKDVKAADNISVSDGDGLKTQELDYVLGRPMTEGELQQEKAITRNAMSHNGYIAPQRDETELILNERIQLYRGILPSGYDSRNVDGISRVSSVKNQNPHGTCWAFAAVSCAESDMIAKGYMDASVDFSERHLLFFAHHSAPDIFGNDYEDSISYDGTTGYLECGGNENFAYGTLASWKGAVSEVDAPYVDVTSPLEQTMEEAYLHDVAHLQGCYFIHKDDMEAIKSAIMEHGAVGANYYESDRYRNYDTAAYYCNAYSRGNHAITVVGWDDNYSKFNFKEQPENDGAWLIKNSWGTSWGLDGYFWISYEDETLNGFYAFDMELSTNYDNKYQYDFCSTIVTKSVCGTKAASVFEVKGNPGKKELLEAVSINLTRETNVNYSLQIYRNLTDMSDPTSGTPMLSQAQEGATLFAGYYTIPLEEEVVLNQGDLFSVVFSFAETTEVDAEKSYSTVFINEASSRANESYIYDNGWKDYGAQGNGNIRIKAFTKDSEEEVIKCKGVSLTEEEIDLAVGDESILNVIVVPSNASNPAVKWESSNPKVVTVDGDGKIIALSQGKANIIVKTFDGGYVADCKVVVAENSLEPEKTEYAIEYYLNGGKNHGNNPNTYTVETKTIALKNPTRTGYAFGGWYSDSKYTKKVVEITTGSSGKRILYAKWNANKYSIKYKLNGGKNPSDNPKNYTIDTVTIRLQKPTRTGYTFKGWYSDGKYKNKVTQIKKGSVGNRTLYAKWEANKYTVKFHANGGKGTMAAMKGRTYGKSYSLKSNKYKRTGYVFKGWNTKKNGSGKSYKNKANIKNLTTVNDKSITLYAQWKKVTYKISYKLNGGKNNRGNPKTYTVTSSTKKLKTPTRKGYVFKGWYSNKARTKKVTKISKGTTGNIVLYAKWAKK